MLPSAPSYPEFQSVRQLPVEAWRPAIEALATRHGRTAGGIHRFERGENPVFELDGRDVLKLVPPFARSVAEREALALSYLSGTEVPVPLLLGSGEFEGWSYVLQERVDGILLHDAWPNLLPSDRQRITAQLGAILATLHRLPAASPRPADPHWSEWIVKQVERWPGRADVAKLPELLRRNGRSFIEDWLPALRPAASLLHGDLAAENAMVSMGSGSLRVSALIDFGHARMGPPEFDLAVPGLLIGRGEAAIVGALLVGYGWGKLATRDRHAFMACALIHPLGDLRECLALLPGCAAAASWEEVAEAFWPA